MLCRDKIKPRTYNLSDLLLKHKKITNDLYSNFIQHIRKPLKIIEIIEKNGGEARIVGGTIRNILAKNSVTDFDIASSFEPEKNIAIMKDLVDSIIHTGIKYGTITLVIDNLQIEVTSLRKDIKFYGRAADVEYNADWCDDALRRDFTVNAISMDKEYVIYDYFNGIADIDAGIIRFIKNPEERIKEDFLRILRYFRFCSYFDHGVIDNNSYNAVKKLAPCIKYLSGERIKSEMWKILSIEKSLYTIYGMQKDDILQHTTLNLQYLLNTQQRLFDRIAFLPNQPLINLAALMFYNNTRIEDINILSQRWRLSKNELKILQKLCLPNEYLSMIPKQYRELQLDSEFALHEKFLFYVGYEFYEKFIKFLNVINGRKHDFLANSALQNAQKFLQNSLPSCPVNGNDVLEYGISGNFISYCLNHIQDQWVKSHFTLSRSELLNELSKLICKKDKD